MLVDTSILVELVSRTRDDPVVKSILAAAGNEVLFASPIQFGELADVARQRRMPVDEMVGRASGFLELIPVDVEIAVAGSSIKAEARKRPSSRDFSLMDGIVLATARAKGQRLLTMDEDFRGLEDVVMV